jgi:hypothetical protein
MIRIRSIASNNMILIFLETGSMAKTEIKLSRSAAYSTYLPYNYLFGVKFRTRFEVNFIQHVVQFLHYTSIAGTIEEAIN